MDVHEELVKACKAATTRSAVSFASKYLSFHEPLVFPIFDNKAYRTAWRLTKKHVVATQHDSRANVDYGYYCEALLLLIAHLRTNGVATPDLKLLDNVLYDDVQ